MSIHLPSRPSWQNKLRTDPQYFEHNDRFWSGIDTLYVQGLERLTEQCKLTQDLSQEAIQRYIAEYGAQLQEYLKRELSAFGARWKDKPCHPRDVHEVRRELNKEKFLKERKAIPKVTEQELRDWLKDRGCVEQEIGRLLKLHDCLIKASWRPLGVAPLAVIWVLGGALADIRTAQELSAIRRRSVARRRSARRMPIQYQETDAGEMDERTRAAIKRYLAATEGPQTLVTASRLRSRRTVLIEALRELWLLIGEKTGRPFQLMHRLLAEAGLLGEVHLDPRKALDRLYKMLPPRARPKPPQFLS